MPLNLAHRAARRPHRPVPSRQALAAVAALGGWLALAPPAKALEVITISTEQTLPSYLAGSDTEVTITPSGALLAGSTSTWMLFEGRLRNQGRLQAGFGQSAFARGLTFSGPNSPEGLPANRNDQGGVMEAHHLALLNSTLDNHGWLTTGALTFNGVLTQVPSAFASGAALLVEAGGVLQVRPAEGLQDGRWNNYGPVQVIAGGRVQVSGQAQMLNMPGSGTPTPYGTTLSLAAPNTLLGTSAALLQIDAGGSFVAQAGYNLRNDGRLANHGLLQVLPNSALRVAPDGMLLPPDSGNGELVNSGTLRMGWTAEQAASQPAPDSVALLFNRGQIRQTAGLLDLAHYGHLHNEGQLVIDGGQIEVGATSLWVDGVDARSFIGPQARMLVRGQYLLDPGPNATGYLFQSGQLDVAAGGSMLLRGKAFFYSGSQSTVAGELRVERDGFDMYGTTLDLEGNMIPAATMRIQPGGSLRVGPDGQAITLLLIDSPAISNRGLIELGAGSTVHLQHAAFFDGAPIFNDEGGTLRHAGTWTGDGRIVNRGEVRLAGGATMTLASFTQETGLLDIAGGASLSIVAVDGDGGTGRLSLYGGRLSGSGSINGDVFIGGLAPAGPDVSCATEPEPGIACFTPGNSPGTLRINGQLSLNPGTVLELEVERDGNGQLAWDQVIAHSMSFADGVQVHVLIGSGVPGQQLATLNLLSCLGGCDLSAAEFSFSGGQGGEFVFNADGSLSFALAPVPEPAHWALLAAGLAALGLWRRRVNLPDDRA